MPNPVDLPILPSLLQGVPAPGYSAIDVRRIVDAIAAQEGVVASGDFAVTQRAGGAGLGVDVAAGEAAVQGDATTFQGLYYCAATAAFTGATQVDVPAGDATNPTVHQIVLEVKDSQHDGSGLNKARLRCVAGTPTAGATLANRTGAAALPASAIRLADVLMPAGSATATNANIRDRRPWARGADFLYSRTAGDYTLGTVYAAIDATNLSPRLECSGAPVTVKLAGSWKETVDNELVSVALYVDGSVLCEELTTVAGANGFQGATIFEYSYAPAAGSHAFQLQAKVGSGTGTINGGTTANRYSSFVVREDLRQNAQNNATPG